jgi:hypothetical protein
VAIVLIQASGWAAASAGAFPSRTQSGRPSSGCHAPARGLLAAPSVSDRIGSKDPFDHQGLAVPLAGATLVCAAPDGALENKARSSGLHLPRIYRRRKMAMITSTFTTTSTTKETSAQRREQESQYQHLLQELPPSGLNVRNALLMHQSSVLLTSSLQKGYFNVRPKYGIEPATTRMGGIHHLRLHRPWGRIPPPSEGVQAISGDRAFP